ALCLNLVKSFYCWMPPEPKAQQDMKTEPVCEMILTDNTWELQGDMKIWEAFDGRGKLGFGCLKDEVRTAAWMENALWEGRETDLSYHTKGDCSSMEIIFLFFSPSVKVHFILCWEKFCIQKNVASANIYTECGFFVKYTKSFFFFFFFYGQLTISYVESLVPTRERQKQLMRQYCFECDCPLCQNPEKDAEKLAGEEHAWKEVKDAVNEWKHVLARCQNLLRSHKGHLPDTNIYQLKMLDCAMDACINLESWEEALYYGSRTLEPYRLYYPGFHPLRAVQLMRVGKLQYSQGMVPQALETLKQVRMVKYFFSIPLPCFPQNCCVIPPHAFGCSSPLLPAVVFPQAAAGVVMGHCCSAQHFRH
uniref:SET and MYND domain containing 3 n=1 Tax=Zonotrichia albicollis TaxID=44394 RepID=A0A8D2MY38_ZONAL